MGNSHQRCRGLRAGVLSPAERLDEAAEQLTHLQDKGCGRPRGEGRHIITTPGMGGAKTTNLCWALVMCSALG